MAGALLNVAMVLLDPRLADQFTVIQRTEVVSSGGISQITTKNIPGQVGVVTMQSPADLIRRDDGQMMSRKISIVTPYRLRGPGNGFQPDQISLGGVIFTVTEILPYNRFGSGFIEAIAESMNAADPAPV